MNMGVVLQVLSPSMKHRKESDFGAQVLGIGGNGSEGLGRHPEEEMVNLAFVLQSDGREGCGQGKDHVKILDRQEFGTTVFEPLRSSQGLAFGAMPIPARVVGVAWVTTAIAGFQVAPESRGPAGFDGVHDATLEQRERAAECEPVGRAIATKDVRHFQRGPSHREVLRNTEAEDPLA